jgi:hypothetical protein
MMMGLADHYAMGDGRTCSFLLLLVKWVSLVDSGGRVSMVALAARTCTRRRRGRACV